MTDVHGLVVFLCFRAAAGPTVAVNYSCSRFRRRASLKSTTLSASPETSTTIKGAWPGFVQNSGHCRAVTIFCSDPNLFLNRRGTPMHTEQHPDQLANSRLRRASASAPMESPKSRNATSKKPGIINRLIMIPHSHAATR